MRNNKPLKREQLKELGFEEMPHFTIGRSMTYELGRKRLLSASGIGTPNEFLWICEYEKTTNNNKNITDIVCIHNYDYDGYLTITKVKTLIRLLKCRKKFKKQ